MSVCLPVFQHGTVRFPLDGFPRNLVLRTFFFWKICRENSFHQNLTRITGTLHEDHYTFMVSCRIILRMRNVSDRTCKASQNAHFIFCIPLPPHNRAVYEIIWKNIVERGRPQTTVWRIRLLDGWQRVQAHTQKCVLIAFPRQQWLRERAPMLRYTYIACLVKYVQTA